jgi:hypothetical protein
VLYERHQGVLIVDFASCQAYQVFVMALGDC